MSEVWLETTSGLVRADAIVSVQVKQRKLTVRLGVPAGGDQMSGWELGPTEHVVCEVLTDADNPARALVEYVAWIRSRGEDGVVLVSDGGVPVFDAFD